VFLDIGDDGNGGSVDVQCRSADEEISRLPDQRHTERRSSATADVSVSHRLQHESCQKVISSTGSKVNISSSKTQKETIKYDRIPVLIVHNTSNHFTYSQCTVVLCVSN